MLLSYFVLSAPYYSLFSVYTYILLALRFVKVLFKFYLLTDWLTNSSDCVSVSLLTYSSFRFWATVCLSVLSVCNVGVLWPSGWTDQDETWHAGRPRPWPHCVRWGPSSPALKGHSPPIIGSYLLRPNGCMDQDVTWCGGRPQPRRLCVRWGPSSSKKGHSPPIFGPCLVAKRLYASGYHLVRRKASS